MTEILLMRHAKSEHPAGIADRHRPLSARGRRSAEAMGRIISTFDAVPELVITSPARRALDTAQIVAHAGGWDAPVEIVDALYGGGVGGLLTELAARPVDRILAVGHEPTWSMATSALIGGGSVRLATATVVCIETSIPPHVGSGALRWMLHPRLLSE